MSEEIVSVFSAGRRLKKTGEKLVVTREKSEKNGKTLENTREILEIMVKNCENWRKTKGHRRKT